MMSSMQKSFSLSLLLQLVLLWTVTTTATAFICKPNRCITRQQQAKVLTCRFLSSESSTSTSATTKTLLPGQVLVASKPGDAVSFDTACVAHPVVLPPTGSRQDWQMYYYGHDGGWGTDGATKAFIPTGSCGLATSKDGLNWQKVVGPLEKGAILRPSYEDPTAFDSLHVGVGDVVSVGDELHMYYLGGNDEAVQLLPIAPAVTGARMRIGRAKSLDGGLTWTKLGLALDYDETEGLFCSWPRVITGDKTWTMLYHAFNGRQYRVYSATSQDKGETWARTGLVYEGEFAKWDCVGIGTRSLLPFTLENKPGYLMFYEGVNLTFQHQIGASFNSNNGQGMWQKVTPEPILSPGQPPLDETWTNLVVGTPWIVSHDNKYRLYYVAKSTKPDSKHAIGVLEADAGSDILKRESWKAVC